MTKAARTVATPGQDPNTSEQADNATTQGTAATQVASTALATAQGDAFQASATLDKDDEDQAADGEAGAQVANLQAQVDQLSESHQIMLDQNKALAEQVQALLAAGLRVAQSQSPKPVPLPGIDDADVVASKVPVLTRDGWFVPRSQDWAVTAGKGN